MLPLPCKHFLPTEDGPRYALPSFGGPGRLSLGLRVLGALQRGQQSTTLVTSPKQLCPKPGAKPEPPSLPSPASEDADPVTNTNAGKGERSRPNKAPGTHSSRRRRTKGGFGAAEATRPLPAPGGQSAATAASARLERASRLAGRTSPTTHRGVPRPARATATKYLLRQLPRPPLPRSPNLRRLPTMGSPTPPAAASARRRRGRHLQNRAYFSRACPSEGTAEPLPLANMVCREEGAEPRRRRRRRRRYRSGSPELPLAPGPLPGARSLALSLAGALLAALPSLPPRRWLRALSSCQSVSPGRGPIALELLPRRLGLECRRRRRPHGRPLSSRSRALPAPPAPPSAPPTPLPLPPPPLVYLELNRTWLPGRGSEAGGNVPRWMAASTNRRTRGRARAGREGRPDSAGRGSPRCGRLRGAAACSCGRTGGVLGREPLFSVAGAGDDVNRAGGTLVSSPQRGGGSDRRSPRRGPLGVGGRCGSVRWEGAQTPKQSPLSPSRHVRLPYLPLTSPPPRPAPAQPLSRPPFSVVLPLGSDPGPLPRLQPGPQPAPPPGLTLAQSSFRAPGPGLHAESGTARAGAEARGCSFTRSLKYFGKPQSGAARKWPLACFGELGGGGWGQGTSTKEQE
ncbi:hypothetical protein H8959_005495 [Pygathrix nigripes]